MRYFLDTSIIIDLMHRKEIAVNFISDHADDEIVTSSICRAEISAGVFYSKPENLAKRKREAEDLFSSFFEVLYFDNSQAEIFGQIKAVLSKAGELIDDMDILIASACIASQSTLVTANIKHFQRIKNLQVISP